jgi:hypothetical protein
VHLHLPRPVIRVFARRSVAGSKRLRRAAVRRPVDANTPKSALERVECPPARSSVNWYSRRHRIDHATLRFLGAYGSPAHRRAPELHLEISRGFHGEKGDGEEDGE